MMANNFIEFKNNEWNELKIKLRNLVCFQKNAKNSFSIEDLNWAYARENGRQIPYADFNFTNLRDCLISMTDLFRLKDVTIDDTIEIVSVDEDYIAETFENCFSSQPTMTTKFVGVAMGRVNSENFADVKNKTNVQNSKRRFVDDTQINGVVDEYSLAELEHWRNRYNFPSWAEPPKTYDRREMLTMRDNSLPLDSLVLRQIPSSHLDVLKSYASRRPSSAPPSPPATIVPPTTFETTSSSLNVERERERAPVLDSTLLPPNVRVPQSIWEKIYFILRDFSDDGVDQATLGIQYSQRYKRSLGGKDFFNMCHVKDIRELMFALPNVGMSVNRNHNFVYKLQQGIFYKQKYEKYNRYTKRLKHAQLLNVEAANEYDDEEERDLFDLPPQPKEFLPEGTQVPDDLRRRIYYVLMKYFPDGVDVQTFVSEYNRVHKIVINSNRDCNMSFSQLLACMKDLLVCGRDANDVLHIKPLPYEQILQTWQERKRCMSPMTASDDDNNGSSSDNEIPTTSTAPRKTIRASTRTIETPSNRKERTIISGDVRFTLFDDVFDAPAVPQRNMQNLHTKNLPKLATKPVDDESKRITEEILAENLYEKIKYYGSKGIMYSQISPLFKPCSLLRKKIESIDLLKLLKKFPNMFEINNDREILRVRCVHTNLTPTFMQPSSNIERTSPSSDRCCSSPDDNASSPVVVSEVIIESELKILYTALKELERWLNFDEVGDFFEFKIKRKMNLPIGDELKKLILSRPQFFAYSFQYNELLARRYLKSGGTTKFLEKITSIRQSNYKLLDDACYDNFYNHITLEIEEELEVALSSIVDPDEIWLQICALGSFYDPLMQTMNHFYNEPTSRDYFVPKEFLCPGFVCAAFVNTIWCRVEIINEFDGEYLVRCVDFGSNKYVTAQHLRLLKKEYVDISVPAIAVRVAMAFIEPIDADGFGYWGPNVATVVRQYLENPNAKVIIRVKSIRRNDRIPEVILKTKFDKTIIDVNDELVSRGFASYKTAASSSSSNELDFTNQTSTAVAQPIVKMNSFDSPSDEDSRRSSASSSTNHSPPITSHSPLGVASSSFSFGADELNSRRTKISLGSGRGRARIFNNPSSSPGLSDKTIVRADDADVHQLDNADVQRFDNADVQQVDNSVVEVSHRALMPTPPMDLVSSMMHFARPILPNMASFPYVTAPPPSTITYQGQSLIIQPIYVPYPVQVGARHGLPFNFQQNSFRAQSTAPVGPPPGFCCTNSSFGFRC